MTKFQKIQKISSIIPFCSTVFIFIVTMIELKRKKASLKSWILFLLIFFLSGTGVYLLNALVMSGLQPILNILASGLLLAGANCLCVDLQVKCVSETPKELTTKQKNIIICVSAGAVVAGMIAIFVTLFLHSTDIADTNGEQDTSLAVITMDELLSNSGNYSARGIRYSSSGSATNVKGTLEDLDRDTCKYSVKKISGTKTLQITKADCDTLTLEITSTLTAGNAEIIITVDGEYYTHVALNQTDRILLEDIADQMIAVKMGAESAEITVSVSRALS